MTPSENMTPRAPYIRSVVPIKLPVGISDFGSLARGRFTYVDKTLLINDVLNTGAQVTLVTRPRRFGKTLNQSMLQHFFSPEVIGQPTRGLFDGLAIGSRPAAMAHQGQYPTIFLSLKDVKGSTFEKCEAGLRTLLANLYQQYPELLNSADLNPARRKNVDAILNEEATLAGLANSIRLLSELLYKHHKKTVIVLLDEYDAPIHAAFSHGFYAELVEFMQSFLGAALKDNPYLSKAFLTGILRVSKESLFSGLNNIEVHTVLDDGYSSFFGFTEAEVTGLIQTTGLAGRQPALEGEIKRWYNGYRFGGEVIYNPWSIINCLKQDGALKAHWVNTSDHTLLKQLIAQADPRFKEAMERLLRHESTEQAIDPNLAFGNLESSTALWSLLLFSGYLTATEVRREKLGTYCRLEVPNLEIRYLYEQIVLQWFTDRSDLVDYPKLLNDLTHGQVEPFARALQKYLKGAASYFDVGGDQPERFYHGFVMGLIAGLDETHIVESNRESGDGRYDVMLMPRKDSGPQRPGIIMEFKQVADAAQLEDAAEEALRQIQERGYDNQLARHGIVNVIALGLAFAGKQVVVKSVAMAS